jgi:hypothetical protein
VSPFAGQRRSSTPDPSRRAGARALGPRAARAAAVAAAGLAFALLSAPIVMAAPVFAADDLGARRPCGLGLAHAFTAALNAHDVDALVDLFGDGGAGPTVQADRYAWHKAEIRLWARQQVRANIRVAPYDYRTTAHGATWKAAVHRDDWHAAGVETLAVTNTIWVEDGKLTGFTASLADPRDAERLGRLWRPGAGPDGSAAEPFDEGEVEPPAVRR